MSSVGKCEGKETFFFSLLAYVFEAYESNTGSALHSTTGFASY